MTNNIQEDPGNHSVSEDAKSDDLVEGKNRLLQAVLWPTHMCTHEISK